MSPQLKRTLFVVGSFVLGGGLLYLALRGVDFGAVGDALRTAEYGWLVPLVGVTLLSHYFRAWRWQMLLEALPEEERAARPSIREAFYALMIGYMVNYAAPRLGEVVRAANFASRSRMRMPGVFGTVVVERVLDVVTLGIALVSVGLLYGARLAGVLGVFGGGVRDVVGGLPPFPLPLLIMGGGLLAAAGLLALRWLLRRGGRVGSAARNFGAGLASVLRSRRRVGIVLTSIATWLCYGLMAYFPLRMLGIAQAYGLGLVDAWALMNVGAIGIALPSPGGTGSFHYVTIQTLVHLFGVDAAPAATYALLTHAAQLVFFCLGGFISLLLQGTSLGALRRTAATAEREAEEIAEDVAVDVRPSEA
ncbi:MAG TPA: lysylphosphatidylglycerol synthase transmembrane domain-containing protein [Rubricoccaceae bacterium]|nr:lysylphosphatidylglycerol synthase transmembrane domain-containing protein [Rubricoccaceae bacterium]